MAVSFVKPKLGPVLRHKKNGTLYRMVAEGDAYSLAYQLPAQDKLLALVGISAADYDELCTRYARWEQGDAASTPLLWSEGLPPEYDLSQPEGVRAALMQLQHSPWLQLGTWQLKRIYIKRPQVQTYDEYEEERELERYERERAYGYRRRYYDDYLDDDDDADYVSDEEAQVIRSALEWDELDCVPDPVAPLLHTHQNRWERIKNREFNALLAPLDLAQIWDWFEFDPYQRYLYNMGVHLNVPRWLVLHLLHLWCLFGGCKEGFSYAQELLLPPQSQLNSRTAAHSASQLSPHSAAPTQEQSSAASDGLSDIWGCFYHHIAVQVDVRVPLSAKPSCWDEYLAQYGSAVITAFGGERYSVLAALKRYELFKPELSVVAQYCANQARLLDGHELKRDELERYGIDPNSWGLIAPLPLKPDAQLSSEQQAVRSALLDQQYMGMALEQAVLAYRHGEVPVGAVVVVPRENDASIVIADHNSTIEQHDPTAHAEMLALRKAGSELKNYRLTGATLYVTLEPCCMCAMAALHARVGRIVYGAADPRTGACGSVFDLAADPRHNHKLKVEGGMRAAESTQLLQRFFAERRAQFVNDQEKNQLQQRFSR